jgi:hypothetical protein
MDKIQGIFDSADNIQRFHIEIVGAYDCLTSIKYSVEENIIPRKDDDNEKTDSSVARASRLAYDVHLLQRTRGG